MNSFQCQVNTNKDEDFFVGVKAYTSGVFVHFPIGYRLSDTVCGQRQDVFNLIKVLSQFSEKKDSSYIEKSFVEREFVDSPVVAYMQIIRNYLEYNAYYTDTEILYKTSDSGNISFSKTINKQLPLINPNKKPIYLDFTTRQDANTDQNLITQIHKYCVYESFMKLGWLYTSFVPPKPNININIPQFISVVNDKLAETNNENDKLLFSAMKSLLESNDENSDNLNFIYGTYKFEHVWENIVDRMFGIKDKEEYFPKTYWELKSKKTKINSPLKPDTIMIYNNELYVLDAKYYKYGVTGSEQHLPPSSDINKQITYGEYVALNYAQQYNLNQIYNCFIMPYDKLAGKFEFDDVDKESNFLNIGFAFSDWKTNDEQQYVKVQGVVADVRNLMYNYVYDHKEKLSEVIKSGFLKDC